MNWLKVAFSLTLDQALDPESAAQRQAEAIYEIALERFHDTNNPEFHALVHVVSELDLYLVHAQQNPNPFTDFIKFQRHTYYSKLQVQLLKLFHDNSIDDGE